jgi:hypothetical protein
MDSLVQTISMVVWGLNVVLFFVGCACAFSRGATLLGAGLGLLALSMLTGFLFSIALQQELFTFQPDGAQAWFWPLNTLFQCAAVIVLIIGVLRIPKRDGRAQFR